MTEYIHLTQKEREIIDEMLSEGAFQKDIAQKLGRDGGTISREITRNRTLKAGKGSKKIKESSDYQYNYETAQRLAEKRSHIPRTEAFLAFQHPPLMNYILTHMKPEHLTHRREAWSPDVISGTLTCEHGDDPKMQISHETLYQFIYSPGGEALGLKHCLLRSHVRRKKQTGRSVRKAGENTKINHRVDIEQRPTSIETREEFGHYEGDSVLSGQKKGAALHTEIERKSRYYLAKKIKNKTAADTLQAQQDIFGSLPALARLTDTLDNGAENSQSYQLTELLKMSVYYAKPYRSCDRGSNEHGNGMLRRFFPKGTNFDNITQEELDSVLSIINHRPRKILGYKSAHEVFHTHLTALL